MPREGKLGRSERVIRSPGTMFARAKMGDSSGRSERSLWGMLERGT